MPRVSVVIPAFNAEQTIAHTIGSVQDQTFTDWELVVGDDQSTDATVQRVHAIGDARIAVVVADSNGGPAVARNRALQHVSGELVAFLDADDWWRSDYLASQVRCFDDAGGRAGGIGAVACDATLANEDGSLTDATYLGQFGHRSVGEPTVISLLRRNTVYVSCLVDRGAGEEVGWFDVALFGTEDHDLWLKILETGRRILVQQEPLAVYRQTSSSISRNTSRQGANNQLTMLRALDRDRLSAQARRVARSELRYNRALELVAGRVFDGKPIPPARCRLSRGSPSVARVTGLNGHAQ